MILLSVQPGEELIGTLTRKASEAGITDGAIVSLIGAVDSCTMSNMPADNSRSDILTEYEQPFELTGTGEISDGKVHVHIVAGREGDSALTGHLHAARVETHFVHAYVIPMQPSQ